MTIRRILILYLLLCNCYSFAQHRIKGSLKDELGEPITFTNIVLLSDGEDFIKGTISDQQGAFTLDEISSGNYILKVTAVGFENFQQKILLNMDLDVEILTLNRLAIALDEVVMSAQKSAFVRKADRTIVNVSSLATAAGGNALDLLEKSPTVRLDRVSGNVSLLGQDGVLVFINGKRSRLDGNELLQFLATIPTANIKSLELIHNPPASYDADGKGGIINIITQNYELDGVNGTMNLFGGYGQRRKYGVSSAFNYKSANLNLYGDGSFSQDYTFQNSDIVTSILFDNGLLETQQKSIRPAFIGNYQGKLGLSYIFGGQTLVDIFGSFSRRRWELAAETTTNYSGEVSPIQQDLLTGNETNTTNQYNISALLKHQFEKGGTLSVSYDYLNFNIINPTSYQLSNFDDKGILVDESLFQTQKNTPFDFHVGRIDYQDKLSEKVSYQVGAKLTLSNVENNSAFLNGNGRVNEESIFTDRIDLNESIYAAYVSVEGKLNKNVSFAGGLRYEYSDLELTARREDISRQISRLFPTISLTRDFSEFSRLTLGYRERISRPGFQNLAPAFFFLNPYTVLTGNVQALANINRTIDISLNHKSLFTSLSYSQDNDPIIGYSIPRLDQEENLLLLIADNIEDRKQIGLNVGFPITFTNFWDSRYDFGGFWRRDEIAFTDEIVVEAHPFFTIDVSQSLQIKKTWSLELSGTWNSLVYEGTIYRPEQATLNFGLQKKFKKATLGLSWTDIFNSGSFFGSVNELPERGIRYDWNYDFEGSIFRISWTYNFGANQVKKYRESGASEVMQRVN